MLLDFYEHGFRFSEKKRCQIAHSASFLSHIDEIQKAFFDQKIKICSAFARNRIKACALTLEGLLPPEVKERGECGARHPLYARVNTLVTDREAVIHTLKKDGFELVTDISAVKEERLVEEDELEIKSCFAIDQDFEDLLLFPSYLKDDVYNHDLALDCRLIPQVYYRYILRILSNIQGGAFLESSEWLKAVYWFCKNSYHRTLTWSEKRLRIITRTLTLKQLLVKP